MQNDWLKLRTHPNVLCDFFLLDLLRNLIFIVAALLMNRRSLPRLKNEGVMFTALLAPQN
jgi:hypothetical protein